MEFSPQETAMVVAAIVAVLGVLTTFGSKLMGSAKDHLSAKTSNVVLQSIIDAVSGQATNVIQALNQELVNDLKAKSEDGKLSKEDAIDIKNAAINRLLDTISSEAQVRLTAVFGNLSTYLSTLLEAKLEEMKKK